METREQEFVSMIDFFDYRLTCPVPTKCPTADTSAHITPRERTPLCRIHYFS